MYNLIEYNSNYSEATGSLWLYSKDEATDFNADIVNTNDLESFKNYQNVFLAKGLKGQLIGMSRTQKVRIKIRKMNIVIFSNQILLELIDYLFWFIQIKMPMLKDLMLRNIIYQKT